MRLVYHFVFSAILLIVLPAALLAAEDTLTLGDGVSVRVLYFEPENQPSPPPLAVFMTGGLNNEFMARAQFWMGKELVDRGWSIAVPISGQGRKFFVENSSLMPEIISQLRDIHDIADRKALLIGISSGGSAALAIAAKAPENYLGVIATPGRIWDETRFSALQGLPIFLRVGENDDFRWHRRLESHAELLRQAGGRVDAALVPNANHIFPLDWVELEAWLANLPQPD